ncbi:hypothetical protein E2C01_097191 [Portunus trituberculatus]|uniref:Uncharacterized protein n=1 Tax=Portunus trituberculatus TaxID=210409 RepID=A0A5B7K525_PORTR|nr:hypothetical protein [Portunus trituberculatus]
MILLTLGRVYGVFTILIIHICFCSCVKS